MTTIRIEGRHGSLVKTELLTAGSVGPKVRFLFDRAWDGLTKTAVFRGGGREIDVLLVPSSAETFGLVYLEAMSQGVPVLYTRGQGFDGQFADGEVGWAVPCRDIRAQAEALRRVAQGDYAALSARCAEQARRYAWPEVAGRWLDVYAAFAGKNGGREG